MAATRRASPYYIQLEEFNIIDPKIFPLPKYHPILFEEKNILGNVCSNEPEPEQLQ